MFLKKLQNKLKCQHCYCLRMISMMTIVITGHHKMRTVTNLLIFNLSLTDLINTVFNSTFSYIFMKNRSDFQSHQSLHPQQNIHVTTSDPINELLWHRNWIFGVLFCRLTAFMTHLAIVASVLTMAAIAGERSSYDIDGDNEIKDYTMRKVIIMRKIIMILSDTW